MAKEFLKTERLSLILRAGRRRKSSSAHRRGNKFVRMHFRGLRDFVWNGYQISVSVPGKDYFDIMDTDAKSIIVEEGSIEENTSKSFADLVDIVEKRAA